MRSLPISSAGRPAGVNERAKRFGAGRQHPDAGCAGRRVRELLERYEDAATFYSPDVCFEDARYYLSQVLEKRGLNVESGLAILEQIGQLVVPVDPSLYSDYPRTD
jgi:hypothetical protein